MEFGVRTVDFCGYEYKTYPVSEGRIEIISDVISKVQAKTAKYDVEVPREVLGELRKLQLDAMGKFVVEPPKEILEGKDFPLSTLHDLQSFFLMNSRPI